jgi:replication factor C small subunit
MVDLSIAGNFLKAREKLDHLLINYGLSAEDVLIQTYREIPNLTVSEKRKMKLVEAVAEANFRLISGANDRIQLEALIAKFALSE